MSSYSVPIFHRPESESEISALVERLLYKAGAIDVIPTPIEGLIEAAGVFEVSSLPDPKSNFLSSLNKEARRVFKTAVQKIRGMADLRERVVYVPVNDKKPRIRFAKAHELAHQVIPWHQIRGGYLDDDKRLSPNVRETFEQEANFFSADLIFQGDRFTTRARDFRASFGAVFTLADQYEASNQATLWRYVEEQDEAIAVAQYYLNKEFDRHGRREFKHWKTVPSPKFFKAYHDVHLPKKIVQGHPWTAAWEFGKICNGNETLVCGEHNICFSWEAWWNTYTLFVLLRRKPKLHVISKLVKL